METVKMMRVLGRYSQKCISDRLDPDFAKALEEMKSALRACRNELCLRCGDYKEKHLGRCEGCRWEEI